MARLTITESARADLREIRDYIAKDNPAAARRVVERLRAQARKLAATPGIGRKRGDLRPDLFSFAVGRRTRPRSASRPIPTRAIPAFLPPRPASAILPAQIFDPRSPLAANF
jgi:plasmid stabilization system protein ParE